VAIGNHVAGKYGIGTFVADSEAQSLAMSPRSMLSLAQVRNITVAPEASTLTLLAAGTEALLSGFRPKNRSAWKFMQHALTLGASCCPQPRRPFMFTGWAGRCVGSSRTGWARF
jgi:hypothetical protein